MAILDPRLDPVKDIRPSDKFGIWMVDGSLGRY